MDCKEAIMIFENSTKKSVVQIERCSIGIGNYVFAVSTIDEKFILRCSKEKDAYKATVYLLSKLSVCEIPVPLVLSKGTYKDYSYLILSHIPGDDIGSLGDMLTFVALTKVALLNMDLDTKYIDYLLNEIHPNAIERKAFVFYCLLYCVDFMGERDMQFLDKKIPVNESIIKRLNNMFDILMEEWNKCSKR